MEKIKIFSDSACDLSQAEVEKYDITIVPIHVAHEGRTFQEFYDMTPQQYWKLLQTSDEVPKTSQITPVQVLEVYRTAKEEGYTHILGIIINGSGSGSLQSCMIARDMFYDEYGTDVQIELLDSETYTYMYGRALLEASKMRAKGDRFQDIVNVTKARLCRTEAVLGVYTLRYLKKSGRITGAAAFAGEALGLKPIMLVNAGSVDVIEKARGEKNLVPRVLDVVRRRVVHPEGQTAVLLHGDLPEKKIAEIEKEIRSLGFADVTRNPIGISVITNTGPEAFAIMYYGEQRPVE